MRYVDHSWIYACGICCLWPLAFHFGWTFIAAKAGRIDWSSIRWPWRKQ